MGERGGGRLADMDQNPGDGIGVGQERDERERRLAGGTDEGKDFIDPSLQGGPPGRPGGGGVGGVGWLCLWLGSRGRGGCRERKRGTGRLSGQREVLEGPGRDEGSQGLSMGAGRWPGWWCGPPGYSLSGTGLCGHRRPLASRGEGRSVSTTRRAKAWGGGMGERVPPQESWAWRRPWRQRIIPTPSWIQPHGEFGLKRPPGGGYDERIY
jgi:hypothetical protein